MKYALFIFLFIKSFILYSQIDNKKKFNLKTRTDSVVVELNNNSFIEYKYNNGIIYSLNLLNLDGKIMGNTYFYSNGNVRIEVKWNNNGTVKRIFNYDINEKLNNISMYYSNEGIPLIKEKYLHGKKNGEWKKWYKNGTLKEIKYFTNNIEDSLYISYYSNGKKKEKGFYNYQPSDSVLPIKTDTIIIEDTVMLEYIMIVKEYCKPKNNKWQYWNEEGKLIKEEIWDKGELIETKEY